MELLYIWVEEYKNIKNQGFNFSPKCRFDFTYDASGTSKHKLKVEKRENVIENFFDEGVSNVTAIVGQNGAGKTTLLEILSKVSPRMKSNNKRNSKDDFDDFIEKNYILVFLINNQFYFESSYKDLPSYLESSHKNLSSYKYIQRSSDILNSLSIFYHSNIYTRQGKTIDSSKKVIDISTEKFTSSQSKTDENGVKYRVNHVLNQANFIKIRDKIIDDSILRTPRHLILSFEWQSTVKHKIEQVYKTKVNDFIKTKPNNKLIQALVVELAKSISSNKSENPKKLKKLLDEILENKIIDPYLMKFKERTDDWTKKTERIEKESYFNGKEYYLTLNDTDVFLDCLENIFSEESDSSICIENWNLSDDLKRSSFSTGEFFFLELFARLYPYIKILEKEKNILFLFDEVDLGYHPAWQRRIINILISSLPKMFEGKNIQIVVTSHSPFIISDLPNENVIFLTKEEEMGNCIAKDSLNDMKKTFGANIHTLLSDSFFMESLMGEFAKSKIDTVLKTLSNPNSNKNQLEDAETIISMIGEPVIKRYLRKELDSKRLKKVDEIEIQIQSLQDQIDLLNNIKQQAI